MKKDLIPVSKLHGYLRATINRPVKSGESVLDLVAKTLCQRHGLYKGSLNSRTFVEKHRNLVLATQRPKSAATNKAPEKAPKIQKSTATLQLIHQVPVTSYSGPPVDGDEFLRSYEWRRLRMSALKKHGARCQCCGASPATGAVMNVDHIKPRKLFPELALSLDNLQVLCDSCNHGKGNWDMTDWRERSTVP